MNVGCLQPSSSVTSRAGVSASKSISTTRSETPCRRTAISSHARRRARRSSSSEETLMRVAKLTCSIGAELFDVDLGAASRDARLFDQIKALLLDHKVLFARDQRMSRAEHVAFARRF